MHIFFYLRNLFRLRGKSCSTALVIDTFMSISIMSNVQCLPSCVWDINAKDNIVNTTKRL